MLDGAKSLRDKNSDNNCIKLCDNRSINEPVGRRLSITDLKTEKTDTGNDQVKEQKLQQG